MVRMRAALACLALAAGGCTATVSEESLLRATPDGPLAPDQLARAAPTYTMSEHWIATEDGARLNAVLLRQPGARATILYFGGNGFTIGRFGAMTARWFASLGVDLMIVDHRGYGRSEGRPTQVALEADGPAAFDYLTRTLGVPAGRVVVHGQSLGSFIAGHVAAVRPAGGVVLESSATTAEEWVDASHRGIARALVRVRIDETLRGRGNLANMSRIEEPLLILVGAKDRTTPPQLAQALYAASPLPAGTKTLSVVPGAGHNDVMAKPQTLATYRDYLNRTVFLSQ
jgi:uncharacterized protein